MVTQDKAIPIGLIINELITHVLIHTFPGERTGALGIRVQRKKTIRLSSG